MIAVAWRAEAVGVGFCRGDDVPAGNEVGATVFAIFFIAGLRRPNFIIASILPAEPFRGTGGDYCDAIG
jgi:hypothetical protein